MWFKIYRFKNGIGSELVINSNAINLIQVKYVEQAQNGDYWFTNKDLSHDDLEAQRVYKFKVDSETFHIVADPNSKFCQYLEAICSNAF